MEQRGLKDENTSVRKKYSNPEQSTEGNNVKGAAKGPTNPTNDINPTPQQFNY